ncbi:MAG TPA: protease pro-enzyme activation domain-containing protein [Bryobacteraceae bacterium]|nr:protease pro-enzyme activation domain-containing protein [Bryobacteraceae bacterium]
MKRQLKTAISVAIAAALWALPAAGIAQSVKTRHVRDAIERGEVAPNGRLPLNHVLQLDLVLPLRDPAGLKSFLADVYNPKSPNFRHWLTPQEFTARFGPTQAQYDEVLRFAGARELKVVGGSRDQMLVQVRGTVGAIEAALHVNLNTYPHPTENRTFYGADREPTPDLSFSLWHISGLDNFSQPKPLYVKKSSFAAAHGIYPEQVVSHATTGSGPSASFLGSDMRAAYATGTSLNGSGQHVGLLEYYGTNLSDLSTYYSNVHQTNNVPVNLISTDGTSTSCNSPSCDDTEQTLDITQALGMAPALASLDMYIGSTDTAIISAMTTHNPLPSTIGCSWGWTPADPSTLDPYFLKMAAQGQNFFAASGDSSTWSSRNEAWPADDANVVSVGGTDLVTASAGGPWSSETAWVDSGGGISPDKIAIPSWQAQAGVINSSNKGSTTLRNGPDVSANANFTFYVCADQTTCTANEYGGTSFATPMWAGYIALVNQQLVSNGQPTIGFINPTIYNANVTSSYATNFHDITSGKSGSYSAVTGYDLVTGWGSPTPALITTLSGGSSSTPSFTISSSPSAVSILQGGNGSSTITTTVGGGFNSAISLSVSGAPSGVTATLSPTSIAAPGSGSSTLSIAVGSTAATGTYTLTVTAIGGGITHTTTVSLTVTAPGSGSFTISVSPSSGYLRRGQSGYAVVTTAVSGGFSSAISFSATGVPSGVTSSFTPSSIAAPGSGTTDFNLSVASNATRGTYSITITGTGGGQSHSTVLTLQIR